MRTIGYASGLVVFATSVVAHAEDVDADKTCSDAYTRVQELRRDPNKLTAQRAPLRLCTSSTCAKFIVDDCTAWLGEFETAVPTIIFVVEDQNGNSVSAISVKVDGAPFVSRLDRSALEINPGTHTFEFQAGDSLYQKKTLVIKSAEKRRSERIVLRSSAIEDTGRDDDAQTPGNNSPRTPTAAYVAFAVGGGGLVVGTIFTVAALNSKCGDQCATQSDVDSHSASLTQNTVGAVLGFAVALAGGGVGAWFLLKPNKDAPQQSVRVAPSIGLGWAGIKGTFQ